VHLIHSGNLSKRLNATIEILHVISLVVKTRVPRPRPPKKQSRKNAHTYRAQNNSLQKTLSFQALLIVINTTAEVGIKMWYKKNFNSWKRYFFTFFRHLLV